MKITPPTFEASEAPHLHQKNEQSGIAPLPPI